MNLVVYALAWAFLIINFFALSGVIQHARHLGKMDTLAVKMAIFCLANVLCSAVVLWFAP